MNRAEKRAMNKINHAVKRATEAGGRAAKRHAARTARIEEWRAAQASKRHNGSMTYQRAPGETTMTTTTQTTGETTMTTEEGDETVTKDDVAFWETVNAFVATFPASDDEDGACDVEVQIGEAGGRWYLRTQDDAGGDDDCDETSYETRGAAVAAAEAYAREADEGKGAADAEGHAIQALELLRGKPDPTGAWACYWSTVDVDGGREEGRYASSEQARAAVNLANRGLEAANPGGNLRCGYEVRALVDDAWETEDDAL